MTPEMHSIIGVGIVLAGIILNGQRNLRAEIERRFDQVDRRFEHVEGRITALDRGQARLEGLLEGLREAVTGRRAAASDG